MKDVPLWGDWMANGGTGVANLLIRLAWFAGLWLAGVATVGAVSLAIKWALR